jgi:hypothetical protein
VGAIRLHDKNHNILPRQAKRTTAPHLTINELLLIPTSVSQRYLPMVILNMPNLRMDIQILVPTTQTLTELSHKDHTETTEGISKIMEEMDLSTWLLVNPPLDNVQQLHAGTAEDAR